MCVNCAGDAVACVFACLSIRETDSVRMLGASRHAHTQWDIFYPLVIVKPAVRLYHT